MKKVNDILYKKVPKAILFVLMVGFMLGFSPFDAKADLRICNKTSEMIGVAIGYRDDKDWQSAGWWRIPADQCASVIETNLTSRFYYLYAEHASQEKTWVGNIYMCSSREDFEITGIKDCYARGFEKLGFFEVDTGDQDNWTVQFKDEAKIAPETGEADEGSADTTNDDK